MVDDPKPGKLLQTRLRIEYKKVITLDPYKNMEVSGEGSSKTYIDTPDSSYRVGKTRLQNKGVLMTSKPVATIDGKGEACLLVTGGLAHSIAANTLTSLKLKLNQELNLGPNQDYDDKLRRNALKAMLGRQIDDVHLRPGTQLRVGAYNSDKGPFRRQSTSTYLQSRY